MIYPRTQRRDRSRSTRDPRRSTLPRSASWSGLGGRRPRPASAVFLSNFWSSGGACRPP